MLAVEPNITARRIGDVIGFDKAAVSRALKGLKERELVKYQDANENRRQQLVTLTKNGQALHDEIIQVALAREQALLYGFTKEETMFFISLLHKLHGNIGRANAIDADSKPELLKMVENKKGH